MPLTLRLLSFGLELQFFLGGWTAIICFVLLVKHQPLDECEPLAQIYFQMGECKPRGLGLLASEFPDRNEAQ